MGIESDQTSIECGVPQSGQQKSVMHVESLRVGCAIGPWDHVRGPQQRRIRNSTQRAGFVPIFHQGIAKDALPDPEFLCAFAFSLADPRDGPFVFLKGKVGQAN